MKQQFTVQTYNGQTGATGHGNPLHNIQVEDGQGLTISLPPDVKGATPDIYIERVVGTDGVPYWSIGISPEEVEIKTTVSIFDNGQMDVRAADGTLIQSEEADPVEVESVALSDCIASGKHLKSCDDDGYCNSCGHQESE